MGQQRRSFTPEFKQEAVDLCRRSGKSECQMARELGIPKPLVLRLKPSSSHLIQGH
jgi:transposase-like protein